MLSSFTLAGVGLVAYTYSTTQALIANNERAAFMAQLHDLIPPKRYDNVISQSVIYIRDARLGSTQDVAIYRAFKDQQPVAALASVIAPDGYSGAIKLLIAVYYDGTLAGVRVLAHRETPGLGDAIELRRSDWLLAFTGRSLADPPQPGWQVKKDGGEFDQFTGATITPRAIVKAVRNFLQYTSAHREQLFKYDDTISTQLPTDH